MSLFLKLFFIFILFFAFEAKAEMEPQKVNLLTGDSIKLDIKNVKKYSIIKSYVANIKLNPDSIEINAKNQGNTYVYLWGKELQVLLLNVDIKKIEKKPNNDNFTNFRTDEPFGTYTVNTSPNLTGKTTENLGMNHTFSYKMPLFDGHLNFRTSALTATKISEVSEISLQNLNLNYKNKNFLFETGTISSDFLTDSSLKGIGIKYFSPQLNLNFITGLASNSSEIKLYSKNKEQKDDKKSLAFYIGGLYSLKNFQLQSDFFSNSSLSDQTKNFGMNLNFKYNPFENLNMSNNLKTDFKSLLWSSNIFSNYKFPAIDSAIEANLATTNEFSDKANSNYSLNLRLRHGTDTSLNNTFTYTRNLLSEQKTYSVNLSREVFKDFFNLYGQFDLSADKKLSKNFQLGSNLKYRGIFPTDFSYRFNYSINDKNSMNNDFLVNVDLLNNSFMQINLNEFFNLDFSEKNSLSNNLSLITKFVFNDYLSSDIQLGYQYNIEDTSKPTGTHQVNAKISNSLKLFNNNEIKFSVNAVNTNMAKNNFNISSNINYVYSFGVVHSNRGKITGMVFEDKNCNSVFDDGDIPVPDIKVFIKDKETYTNNKGVYEFSNLEFGKYEIRIDTTSLKKGYKLTTSVFEEVNLDKENYNYNFGVTNKISVKGYIYSSKTKNKGLANIEVKLDDESALTDDDGAFYFRTIPGLHQLQIEHTSIPKNYKYKGKLTEKVEVSEEKENKFEYIFKPKRLIKLSVYKSNNKSNVVKDLEVQIKHKLSDSQEEKTETIKTDEDGEILLSDLEEGQVEISSKRFKEIYKVDIPDDPLNKDIDISI